MVIGDEVLTQGNNTLTSVKVVDVSRLIMQGSQCFCRYITILCLFNIFLLFLYISISTEWNSSLLLNTSFIVTYINEGIAFVEILV